MAPEAWSGQSAAFEETIAELRCRSLDEPNMIFVTVSATARPPPLLEGRWAEGSRTVPLFAKFPSVEDYTAIDPAFAPIGKVAEIVAQIERCKDPAEFDALTWRELVWYARETCFAAA